MKIANQTIKIRRIVDEVYTITNGTKFKSILTDKNSTPQIVKDSLLRCCNRNPTIDTSTKEDILQENLNTPVIQVVITFQYSTGIVEDVIIWDSLKGYNNEGYNAAKKKGLQIDKVLERNKYIQTVLK